MKKIQATLLMLSTLLSVHTFADEPLRNNVINLQAEASRPVSNDKMQAVLYIEKSHKQPAVLANQVTNLMNDAVAQAKKYSTVKIETGSQSTYPIYESDGVKFKEWRSRAEINIESRDFKAASQLIAELQQTFQTQSINFTVSTEQRQKVENELMAEATKNFQQRAQILTQAWNKSTYQLVNLNVNSGHAYPQPIMVRAAMAKFNTTEAADSQSFQSGESTISVNLNGSIQLK